MEKVFGIRKVIVKDVEMILESMDDKYGEHRLQVLVLLFLSKVIRGRRRFGVIYPFNILKIVNNLKDVETFHWGQNTLEDNMNEIDHMLKHLDGKVHEDYLFPGFLIPLKIKMELHQ